MMTDKDNNDQTTTDQADENAAFEAAFSSPNDAGKSGKSDKTETPAAPASTDAAAEAPADTQEAAPAAKAPAEEAAPPAPSPAPAVAPDYQLEIRKLNGRIGSLNDQLQQVLKSKEAEGKPAVLSTVQLTRLKDEYPEMADMLEGDIAEVIENLAHKTDPKEIQSMVSQGVAQEVAKFREETVSDAHENWKTDLWADAPGGTRTAEYEAWAKTMSPAEFDAFEQSNSPAFVIRKLSQFYDWKGKAAKTETEKNSRLKAAITPQGTARASPQTMSDAEAERKAFEDAFNT